MQRAAESKGMKTKEFCDKVSHEFRDSFVKAEITFDDFIRTTEPRHEKAVHHLWDKLKRQGDIYLGQYEGWYSVSDEAFLGKDEVELSNDKMVSKLSGHPVEQLVEDNYKFKLGKYKNLLMKHLVENPGMIRYL